MKIFLCLDKSRSENQNTHFIFNNLISDNRAVYDNFKIFGGAREATSNVTMWRIRVACWISKAIRTHAHAHAHAHGHKHSRARARAHTQMYV
jgi:hypothetical protein